MTVRKLYDEILIPSVVLEEVAADLFPEPNAYLRHYGISDLIQICPVNSAFEKPELNRLHDGEKQAIQLAAFNPMHEVISLFMGHGFELLFATIFLYRAISGSAIIIAVERPLYGFLGLFIEFRDIRFAYRLITSHSYRIEYGAAKGGGHWMDFSRIARDYLHVDLTVVATFFLFCCFIPPIVAFLAYRYRIYWMEALSKLLSPEPE